MADLTIPTAMAMGTVAAGSVLLIAAFERRQVAKPEADPRPVTITKSRPRRVSKKSSAAELRALCREHRINNGRWRANARKASMVRALNAHFKAIEGPDHV